MRAIVQSSFGDPSVLELAEVQRPEPAGTEVLVRVLAAGVNPVDWKTRGGRGPLREPPFTVGWDIAGEVVALGQGVTRFAVGDRVFGMPRFPREAGGYAEYVTAPSRQLARTPDGLSDVEAGALPLAALTAWQALVDTAAVKPGDRVLVQAAAGGVGHLAVQIAKSRGAYVSLLIAIPSSADLAALERAAGDRGRVTNMLVEPDRAGLEAIAALVESGALRVRVARTFPLAEAAAAHELGERGEIGGGKLVLIP
jgi:NADPH:quinone reductase-like Zn-dependent oxidoreductase